MTPQQEILKRLVGVYGEPKTPDVETFFEEFAKALDGYSREALHLACSRVIRARTFWPKPAEILEHVPKVSYHPKFIDPPTPESTELPTPESRARVAALISELRETLADKVVGAENPHWNDVTRPAFEKRQAECPVPHLHRRQP